MTDDNLTSPIGFVFVTECEVFGEAADPSGHILVQVDERTYRRATGQDLAALERLKPGLIGRLPRYLPGDWEDPKRGVMKTSAADEPSE
jgi:hypothetical protein